MGDLLQIGVLEERLAAPARIEGQEALAAFEMLADLYIQADNHVPALETIDRLLKQLEEAAKNAKIAVIDLQELSQFANPEQMQELDRLQKQVEELMRQMAEQQGLQKTKQGYQLTPQAYKLFQGKLLEKIFSDLESSRTGRHQGPIVGEGAVELTHTKDYEFGDSLTQMDVSASFQFLADALPGDWHLLAPDWRGFGLSQTPEDGYWFADYVADPHDPVPSFVKGGYPIGPHALAAASPLRVATAMNSFATCHGIASDDC